LFWHILPPYKIVTTAQQGLESIIVEAKYNKAASFLPNKDNHFSSLISTVADGNKQK